MERTFRSWISWQWCQTMCCEKWLGYKMAGVFTPQCPFCPPVECCLFALQDHLHVALALCAYVECFIYTKPMYSIWFCWYSLNSCGFFLFHVLNAYIVSTSSVVIVTASLVTPGWVCAACLDVFCGLCVNNAPENLWLGCAICTKHLSKHFRSKSNFLCCLVRCRSTQWSCPWRTTAA